jgi:alanyl-tRNA synthetase
MTERLYYTDPYLTEFDATIVNIEHDSDRRLVTLDRTTFYPTSGGQPFDTGSLGGAQVVDVYEDERTLEVVHVLNAADSASLGMTERVHGAVDWQRRFDHMQQHTGQHVLSAAFDRLFGARTVSFHLGAESSTIDLARELSAGDIASAEDQANQVVWEDRPVSIRFASAEEAARLPLRKESAREGTLRLIDVERFDLSACGGTHVARTGGIGVIAVNSWERFKGGQRVEFLCGNRALKRFRALRDAISGSVRLLSVAPDELPAAIERLQVDAKEQKRAMSALQLDVARYRADEVAATGEEAPSGRIVMRTLDLDANALKVVASSITAKPGFVVVLVSAASPSLVVVARSADVNVASNQVLAALTAKFGGRGGGKPDLAQGGGLVGAPEEILQHARQLVTP